MRIGIDARLWNQTGVGRYIRNLTLNLQNLDKNNDYVLFVRSEDYDDVKFKISNSKFKISKCDIRWHSIEEQLKMPAFLFKENLDLVHFPYFSVPIFYNRSYVVTIHDLILNHFQTGEASTLLWPIYKLKLLGYKFVVSKAAKFAKKIIVPSNATKNDVIKDLNIDKSKIVVTYEGVDENMSKREISNLKSKERYFLYVGNFYPHKNLIRLIDAFDKLKKDPNSYDVKLFFVGKKDFFYEKLYIKVKSLNLGNSVLFLEQVDDKKLKSLYSGSVGLVVPSLMEGFGLPALEAMANRCLVLASDIASLREICDGCAVFFDPKNIDDIYQKMKFALEDKNNIDKIIEKGLSRSKVFSWENMAKETLKVYESCVSLRQNK